MNPAWQNGRGHAWVFDLDGTLTIAQHDFDAIRAALGIPKGALILEFIAQQPPGRAAQMRADLDDMEIALAKKSRAAVGALALLTALRRQNQKIGVLTRNTRRNALAALTAIDALGLIPNECILGRDEATPKPDPAGIHKLLRDWSHGPEEATMVGDYRLDLAAGRGAGCYTVHVSAGRPERWPELTDLHVPTLRALQSLILQNGVPTNE